jgi:hypothetical protein
MARTRRRKPTGKQSRQQKAQREFDEKYGPPDTPTGLTPAQEAEVVAKGVELTRLLNAEKQRVEPLSVQAARTDDPFALQTSGYLWWTGCTLNQYIPVAEYGTVQRQRDLQAFVLTAELLLAAEAAVIKKAQGLQWTLEGGRNLTKKWQELLLNVSNGRGWDFWIARLVRSYLESDNGGVSELIRAAPSWAVDDDNQITDRGKAAIERGADASWPIVDMRVMDPTQIVTTRSEEYPLIYSNPVTGQRHKLRGYNFVRLIDMPSVSWRHENSGTCAVSRALISAQEDRMISRFIMEKLSENPGSGIMFVNADTTRLETALKAADDERSARGVIFYKGVIFIPVLNPDGNFGVDFVDFAGLPDGFSRQEYYNILKERVATAFGLDVLELGSIPGGNLGTAQQATTAAAQSRGKVLAVIIGGVEREFRFKVLPESLDFAFESQEIEERKQEAEVQKILFENAQMYVNIAGPELANQYLVDMKAVPPEYLMSQDITGETTLDDAEAPDETPGAQAETTPAEQDMEKWYGPRVKAWKNGKILALPHLHIREKQVERLAPLPGPPLPELDATITEDDIDKANAAWDVLFPELAGMLEARPSSG